MAIVGVFIPEEQREAVPRLMIGAAPSVDPQVWFYTGHRPRRFRDLVWWNCRLAVRSHTGSTTSHQALLGIVK
ncbi:hypothetical protein B296_00056099, partial [Ensete ventricosum]